MPNDSDTGNGPVYLPSGAVRKRYGNVSQQWIERRLADPKSSFPKPVKLGGTHNFWRLSDLLAWEAAAPKRKAGVAP